MGISNKNSTFVTDMDRTYNIYCDESCHLEHDRQKAMVLGGVWCSYDNRKKIARQLRALKIQYRLSPKFEVKWNKVSPSRVDFYLALVDFFFDNPDLHFRAFIIPDKSELHHEAFSQTHDEFYYKCYFRLLKTLLEPGNSYNIYLDIKDTQGESKVQKLHEYLCNSRYDFDREMIRRVQQVRSHELELVALADLFIGALSYVHRGLHDSKAKMEVIERIRQRSGYQLMRSTLYRENKFNLFVWHQS